MAAPNALAKETPQRSRFLAADGVLAAGRRARVIDLRGSIARKRPARRDRLARRVKILVEEMTNSATVDMTEFIAPKKL